MLEDPIQRFVDTIGKVQSLLERAPNGSQPLEQAHYFVASVAINIYHGWKVDIMMENMSRGLLPFAASALDCGKWMGYPLLPTDGAPFLPPQNSQQT